MQHPHIIIIMNGVKDHYSLGCDGFSLWFNLTIIALGTAKDRYISAGGLESRIVCAYVDLTLVVMTYDIRIDIYLRSGS